MKNNLVIKYRAKHISPCAKITRIITDIEFYDFSMKCNNSKFGFNVYYDDIEQISDGKILLKFNENDYKYNYLIVHDLIETLYNYSVKGGDK